MLLSGLISFVMVVYVQDIGLDFAVTELCAKDARKIIQHHFMAMFISLNPSNPILLKKQVIQPLVHRPSQLRFRLRAIRLILRLLRYMELP